MKLSSKRLRFGLLPAVIFAAVLMLTVRIGDLWVAVPSGGIASARAASEPDAETEAEPSAETASPEDGGDGDAAAAAATATEEAETEAADGPDGLDSEDVPEDEEWDADAAEYMSREDLALLRELSARRRELDQRNKDIDLRHRLLEAAEKRIDQKILELSAIRDEVKALLIQYDDQQDTKLSSLVKIYEKMKPKQAARIFEELDMPVLIEVLERMKESRAAPIMAAMKPTTAKSVTQELARRRQLPDAVE